MNTLRSMVREILNEDERRKEIQKQVEEERERMHRIREDIAQTFISAFDKGVCCLSYEERVILENRFHAIATDIQLGEATADMEIQKAHAVIEYLVDVGKIGDEGNEELCMCLNRMEQEVRKNEQD